MRIMVLAMAVLLAAASAAPKEADVAGAEAWIVEGRVSDNPHQHPIDDERAREAFYFDTVSGGQIVAYSKGKKPDGDGWFRLTGTVLTFEVQSKRPGSKEKFKVRQLSVDETEPLPGWDRVEALVEQLGKDGVSMDRKQEIQTEIYEAGKDAFPVLIAHLDDGRVYEKDRDVANRIGMAPSRKPPAPKLVDVPVSSVCEELLHRLLVPVGYKSPHEKVFKPRGSMFRVEDWGDWWRAHRGESLEQIHERMKPLVDEYFRTGGDSQRVP